MKSFSPRPRSFGIDTARPPSERYRILGRIASGGMAEIYLARMATRSGGWQEVVLKRLMPDLQADREFVQMFYDEARIASMMSHPNIVEIFELGELDGSMFIAMELIRGVNLKEIQERADAQKKPIPLPLVLRIATGALDALAYAHAFRDENGVPLNVVHRDVSPQNILVTYQGEVKLVDFGVAKAEGRLHQTRQGLVKGKFAYMAPEQITGEPVDGRADLFALAEVIYLLALHRHPFFAESDAAVLQAVAEGRATPPNAVDPKFPAPLAAILMRAFQRRPEQRFSDAGQMRDAIEAFLLDRARPPTAETLGRCVRELFAERLQLEEQARSGDDDDLLVSSMRVGQQGRPPAAAARPQRRKTASRVRAIEAPRSRPSPRPEPEPAPADAAPPTDKFAVVDALEVDTRKPPSEGDDFGDAQPTHSELPAESRPRTPHLLDQLVESASTAGDEPRIAKFSTDPDEQVFDVLGRRRSRDDLDDTAPGEATVIATDGVAPRQRTRTRESAATPGTKLGKYTVIERLGAGPVAEVFLAKQTGPIGFERRVQLRRVYPQLSADRTFAEALLADIRAVAELSNPGIVQVLDVAFEGGAYLIALEHVPGWTLAGVIEQCGRRSLLPPAGILCRIVADLCGAIDAAHGSEGAPVLHGGVCPASTLVSTQGAVKLTDFAFAAAALRLDEAGGEPQASEHSAPERFSPELGPVDTRSDLFSAGTVLYELATLRSMWKRATNFETRMAILRDPRPLLAAARTDLPPALDGILDRAVARAKVDRFSSGHAFQLELERAIARMGEPVTSTHVSQWLRALFSSSRDVEEVLTDAGMIIDELRPEELTAAIPPVRRS